MNQPASSYPLPESEQEAPASIDQRDILEILGLIAHIESNAFLQVASAAAAAPAPEQRLNLSRVAGLALERQEMILGRMAELGTAPESAEEMMFTFGGTFDDYNERTEPSTLWESTLKEYVGHGIADDFCRIVSRNLDPQTRDVVMHVLDGGVTSDAAIDFLAKASEDDDVLASRLALWGRRLVGEALSVVQNLVAERPALAHLVDAAIILEFEAEPDKKPEDHGNWLFSQLTAEHTRRMSRLGLAA